MANKPIIEFQAYFLGDGSSTSVQFSLLTDPVLLRASGNTIEILASTLSVLSVTGVNNVGGDLAVTSASYSSLTKTITVNFMTTPNNGQEYGVTGQLEF